MVCWRALATLSVIGLIFWFTDMALAPSAALAAWANEQQTAPGPEVLLTAFSFDPATTSYHVEVSVTPPGVVDRLDPRLLDLQTGESTQFGTEMIPVVGRPAFAFTLPATQLIAGHKYRLAIRAVDTQNQFVRRQTQSASSSEDTTVWATQDFAYNPPQPTSLSFAIDGVDADFVSRTVTISINHSDTAQRLTYEGIIANRAGAVVGHLQPMLLDLTSSVVSVPMPDAMANAQGETEYHLIFRLYDADDRKLITEQSRDFTVAPPPAPGLPQRLAGAFLSVAWLRWSLLGIGATSALIVVLARWPRPKRPLPRPRDAMHV